MSVAATQQVNVKIALQRFGEGPPEMLSKLNREVSYSSTFCAAGVCQVEATRQIHNCATQCFVHWNQAHAVASNANFVPERLQKCLPQADRHIFHGMVIVYLQIAFAFNLKVEQTVAGKQVKHVIEKRNAGIDARCSRPVQIQVDSDVGLFSLANDSGRTRLGISLFAHGSLAISIMPRRYLAARRAEARFLLVFLRSLESNLEALDRRSHLESGCPAVRVAQKPG